MEKSTAGFIGRQKKPGEKKRYGRGVIKENMQIYALMLPTLVLIFIFCFYIITITLLQYGFRKIFLATTFSIRKKI